MYTKTYVVKKEHGHRLMHARPDEACFLETDSEGEAAPTRAWILARRMAKVKLPSTADKPLCQSPGCVIA